MRVLFTSAVFAAALLAACSDERPLPSGTCGACDDAPADECSSPSTLRTFTATGSCRAGRCVYASREISCAGTCTDGACAPDPCAGVTCDAPPPPACVDASTIRRFGGGTCAAGQCAYSSTTAACASGCAMGQCLGDPCAGVTCATPPAPTCADPQTLRSYDPAGACSQGQCRYTERNTTCAEGCVMGACRPPSMIARYPGLTEVQVDAGAALGLRVSPSEADVLVQRTEDRNSFSTGGLAVIHVSPAGAGSAIDLTAAVRLTNGYPRADFSADGNGLYFIDDAMPRRLAVARADGSGLRTVHNGLVQQSRLYGNTLVYSVDGPNAGGHREVFAVRVPNGMPVRLVAAGDLWYPEFLGAGDGARVLVCDQQGANCSVADTATGARTPLGVTGTILGGFSVSPSGAYIFYRGVSRDLNLVTMATGQRAQIAPMAGSALFSPDSRFIAFTIDAPSGWLGQVVLRPLAGGADVTLTAPAGQSWSSAIEFSDAATHVVIRGGSRVAVAPVTGGAFVEVSSTLNTSGGSFDPGPWILTRTGGHIAVVESNRATTVYPTGGGAGRTLAHPVDTEGHYEPVSTNPGLLVFTSPMRTQSGIFGSVVLYPGDGSGPGRVLPGDVLPAFALSQLYHEWPIGWVRTGSGHISQPYTWGWFGTAIVYEARTRGMAGIDVVVATDDLATLGVVASGASMWGVRPGAVPSRLFFGKEGVSGVWMTSVPQTPGR